MKTDIIQTSFAGGEFGPSLFGRTDIAQYANACEIVENFLIRPYGSAISAPGSRYVATVSDSTLRTRLIKFVFNRLDAYAIEMGDKYMRFFTDRGQVVTPAGTEDLSSLTSSTVAFYKLNDSAASTVVIDTKGSFNGTSSTNTTNMTTTGKVGACFDFDTQYSVEIPDNAAFSFSETSGSNPFSVAAWLYVTDTGNYQDFITKYDTGANEQEYLFQLNPGKTFTVTFYDVDHGAVGASISTNQAVTVGWHFFVFTYTGPGGSSAADNMNIYIDGVIVTDVARATNSAYRYMSAGPAKVMIGALLQSGSPARWYADKIDDVVWFNIALSSTQVASLYSSSVYQLTTVFEEDEVFDVAFAQLNDTIWLAHPDHPPQRLIRSAADSWAISDFAFLGGPFLDSNTDTSTTLSVSATQGTINVTAATGKVVFTKSTSTLGHHNAFFAIGPLTAETNSTTGLKEVAYVKITHVINSYTATATVIKNLNVTAATSNWAEGAWSAVRGYPAKVVFHDSRLWFARTNHEPQKVWGSKIFEYDNFALDTEADDDAMNLPLASNEANEIQWLFSGKNLLAGTYGGAFVVSSGGDDVAITPGNIDANEEVGIGSSPIAPKRIGQFLYFLQRFKKKLREMFYVWDLNTYKAVDRTILSPHILGDGIVDMDVQINPDPMLYCVRTEGTLAILSREVDQEFAAWSRRSTTGTYNSIAVIPSQTADYDEAWVIVERWINGAQKKYVEYFENVEVPDRQDLCLYLDSALTYNAYESSATSSTTISLSASSGSVTLTSSGAYFNGEMINKRIRAINTAGTTVGEGTITATASTTSITLSITTTFNALSYAAGLWGVSVASVAGLTHLESETVGILADGTTESLTRTVASGVVTLGSNYFVVSVGFSYNQLLFTLPKEAGTQRGTAQGKIQRFNEIALKVNRSTQNFKYGTDADNLDDINLAITPTITTLYTGILPPQGGGIAMRGGYKRGAQIYIKNPNPLPIEILSIMGELDTNEK